MFPRFLLNNEECEASAPAYLMDIIFEGNKLTDMLIVEYDFHPDIGLLGQNILKNFELTINWKEKTIRLK